MLNLQDLCLTVIHSRLDLYNVFKTSMPPILSKRYEHPTIVSKIPMCAQVFTSFMRDYLEKRKGQTSITDQLSVIKSYGSVMPFEIMAKHFNISLLQEFSYYLRSNNTLYAYFMGDNVDNDFLNTDFCLHFNNDVNFIRKYVNNKQLMFDFMCQFRELSSEVVNIILDKHPDLLNAVLANRRIESPMYKLKFSTDFMDKHLYNICQFLLHNPKYTKLYFTTNTPTLGGVSDLARAHVPPPSLQTTTNNYDTPWGVWDILSGFKVFSENLAISSFYVNWEVLLLYNVHVTESLLDKYSTEINNYITVRGKYKMNSKDNVLCTGYTPSLAVLKRYVELFGDFESVIDLNNITADSFCFLLNISYHIFNSNSVHCYTLYCVMMEMYDTFVNTMRGEEQVIKFLTMRGIHHLYMGGPGIMVDSRVARLYTAAFGLEMLLDHRAYLPLSLYENLPSYFGLEHKILSPPVGLNGKSTLNTSDAQRWASIIGWETLFSQQVHMASDILKTFHTELSSTETEFNTDTITKLLSLIPFSFMRAEIFYDEHPLLVSRFYYEILNTVLYKHNTTGMLHQS